MTDYYINYDKELGMNANVKLRDVIKGVGKKDELIITLDNEDVSQADYIFDVLKNNGFEVLPKGGHYDGQYYIIAHRKK